jgi:hypothetical protein
VARAVSAHGAQDLQRGDHVWRRASWITWTSASSASPWARR